MASFSGDYYRRLRLSKNASRQDIKAAFRRLSRQYHPDLHPNRPKAASTFQSLREAYEVLIDRVQRQQYDRLCRSAGQSNIIPEAVFSQANHQLLNPQTPTDFYLRGIRYALVHNHKAALKEYDQALALNSELEAAYLRRAEARYALGDDPGVLADCQRAIALDPSDSQTHYYLGLARFRLGYVESAIAAFASAIACDPEDAQSFARRGLAYEDLGELSDAAQDLRRAARLYKQQGDVAKHRRLKQYLHRFGTVGQTRPVKIVQKIVQQTLTIWAGLWSGLKRGLGLQLKSTEQDWLVAKASRQESWLQARSPDRLSRRPEANQSSPSQPAIPLRPIDADSKHSESKRRWPLVERKSRQIYWGPGISSRPSEISDLPVDPFLVRFAGGVQTTLRLLTNPAGELVPVYRRLSAYQANRVGYGLAVLANLCFMTGLMSLTGQNSWLEASRLWAAGGIAYVAMLLAVAIARLCLRLRGLWAADIFTVGTAIVPLGLSACIVAAIKSVLATFVQISDRAPVQLSTTTSSPSLATWVATLFILLTLLWAISHALLSLYSGLCQLHPFPSKFVAWFVPIVLAVGLATGLGSWQWLSMPARGLIFQ